jgi:hypothetical protein
LQRELAGRLHRCCTHLKGHGGVKGAIRRLTRCAPAFRFVTRFDVARYYESIVHAWLLEILSARGVSPQSMAVVQQYLQLPDGKRTGVGMTAGGCLSPLLGAVMLTPLDEAMQQLMRKTGIYYVRYMDDFLILAPSRRVFRRAIKCVHQVLRDLQLRLHTEKRFIGRVCRGFDFLGYRVQPGRRLRPSAESHRRLLAKFRRLYEQGASAAALWRYVARWCGWLRGGLAGLVSRQGGICCVFVRNLGACGARGVAIPLRYQWAPATSCDVTRPPAESHRSGHGLSRQKNRDQAVPLDVHSTALTALDACRGTT